MRNVKKAVSSGRSPTCAFKPLAFDAVDFLVVFAADFLGAVVFFFGAGFLVIGFFVAMHIVYTLVLRFGFIYNEVRNL